jgi:hypothetical protein
MRQGGYINGDWHSEFVNKLTPTGHRSLRGEGVATFTGRNKIGA